MLVYFLAVSFGFPLEVIILEDCNCLLDLLLFSFSKVKGVGSADLFLLVFWFLPYLLDFYPSVSTLSTGVEFTFIVIGILSFFFIDGWDRFFLKILLNQLIKLPNGFPGEYSSCLTDCVSSESEFYLLDSLFFSFLNTTYCFLIADIAVVTCS